MSNVEEVDVDNISEEELYKLAVSYFKDNEGKSFHIAYQEKLHLVALTQQASHGSIESASLPALGDLLELTCVFILEFWQHPSNTALAFWTAR